MIGYASENKTITWLETASEMKITLRIKLVAFFFLNQPGYYCT